MPPYNPYSATGAMAPLPVVQPASPYSPTGALTQPPVVDPASPYSPTGALTQPPVAQPASPYSPTGALTQPPVVQAPVVQPASPYSATGAMVNQPPSASSAPVIETPADYIALTTGGTTGGTNGTMSPEEYTAVTTGGTNGTMTPAGKAAVPAGGTDGPGLSMSELEYLMETTLGTTTAGFVGGDETTDMDADGDGRVSPEELEAYQGNVYQYDVPDPALTGVDPLNQMVLDYMGGTGTLPGIANFMDDLDIRHEQQDADFQQSLVNRGITDSTIADNMRRQHERNQANERAMLETNLMQNLVPLYTQTGTTYEGLLDQDRAQSLGEFFQFLDRQTAENRWTDQQKSQALSLMLNALGIGTINPQMPGFSIPAGQPGAGQSIGPLLGNLGTAYLGNPQADLSWLGM